ncbi:MAG TPA: XRE family transcriptional regulator [Luteibacter sp.]|jgi:Zn-dependent peptidase ImmA (M78 family)|uniref:helix-turn-helix domain-containing protein n=1 Tax=Luteibacter sp. TaxID=1886636 RepID=UPI002F423FC9
MLAKFEGTRLQQARFLRGLTLAELGAAVDVTRQSLSLFENNDRAPSPETLEKLSQRLQVPLEFFLRPKGNTERQPRTLVHYRSQRRTREVLREQNRASAILDMAAAVLDAFEEYVDYEPTRLYALDEAIDVLALTGDDIEEIATRTRRSLGLGDGPISDVSLLVENQAVLLLRASLEDGMDGLSAWYGDRAAIVVSNKATYARDRANVAHELGHLVLHRELDHHGELDMETFKVVESQAWRFAGAFLLPAKSFLGEVYSVSLDALVSLKKKWGVSVAAMIRRLRDLGLVDEAQSRYLNIQLRQRGWQRVEPGDDREREDSRLFRKTAHVLAEDGGTSLPDFAAHSRLPRDILASALEVSVADLLPVTTPENVLQFKLKR